MSRRLPKLRLPLVDDMRSATTPWSIALAEVLTVSVLSAQAPRRIPSAPACRSCSVTVEKLVRLSDNAANLDGGASNITVVDRDSRGRYWIADYGSRTAVIVFDSAGKYIGDVGKAGAGPKEFRYVYTLLVGKGDSVHVFDPENARRSVISPTTREIVREAVWPSRNFEVMQLSGGAFVTSGSNGSGGSFGQPLEIVNQSGEYGPAFGGKTGTYLRWMNPWQQRRLAADNAGGLYAVSRRNYDIEQWSADGKPIGAWRPEFAWFPMSEPVMRQATPDEGLAPEVVAAWSDRNGILYVASHARQPDFRRAVKEVRSENGTRSFVVSDYDKYFDTVVDAFDMTAGQLLASTRVDLSFDGKAGAGLLYKKGDDPQDFIDIWRVRLIRR